MTDDHPWLPGDSPVVSPATPLRSMDSVDSTTDLAFSELRLPSPLPSAPPVSPVFDFDDFKWPSFTIEETTDDEKNAFTVHWSPSAPELSPDTYIRYRVTPYPTDEIPSSPPRLRRSNAMCIPFPLVPPDPTAQEEESPPVEVDINWEEYWNKYGLNLSPVREVEGSDSDMLHTPRFEYDTDDDYYQGCDNPENDDWETS